MEDPNGPFKYYNVKWKKLYRSTSGERKHFPDDNSTRNEINEASLREPFWWYPNTPTVRNDQGTNAAILIFKPLHRSQGTRRQVQNLEDNVVVVENLLHYVCPVARAEKYPTSHSEASKIPGHAWPWSQLVRISLTEVLCHQEIRWP